MMQHRRGDQVQKHNQVYGLTFTTLGSTNNSAHLNNYTDQHHNHGTTLATSRQEQQPTPGTDGKVHPNIITGFYQKTKNPFVSCSHMNWGLQTYTTHQSTYFNNYEHNKQQLHSPSCC